MKSYLITCFFIIGLSTTLYSQVRTINSMDMEFIDNLNSSHYQNSINQVYINQVGLNNIINSEIKGESTNSTYIQNGSSNNIDLRITARSYRNNIGQIGDYNNVFENIHSPSANISLNLTQNGRRNHFERHGSNSIGDKLEFTMNGNDKSIIVRNFK
jgi:hypothetical protein